MPFLPGYNITHPLPVKTGERKAKPQKLCYFKNAMYDFPLPQVESGIGNRWICGKQVPESISEMNFVFVPTFGNIFGRMSVSG